MTVVGFVLGILAGFAAALLFLLLLRRRRIARMELDFDALPRIEQSLTTLAGVSDASVHRGNDARVYQNGALFDAMEEDIRRARRTVHLESFVWSAGELERRFVTLLSGKAREGVKVRVLIDAIGANEASPEELQRLRANGVLLEEYCKPHWWNIRRMNHRTHRKLLIVDGEIGYVFGHGFSDLWQGDAHDGHHWRDTGVRLAGPVVHSLQTVFMENWIEEARCVPAGDESFPELEPRGEVDAHVVSSAAGETMSSVALLYTVAIACARREVFIQNPYFVPHKSFVELLGTMVKRGVEVHLMVPGRNTDSPVVRRAGCRLYPSLLRAGVRLYEYERTLLHQKIVIVDGMWAHIGSTNFDARSLALNEEVGVGLLNAKVAAELKTAFNDDLQYCKELTLDEWMQRPWYSGALDWLAYQLQAQI